MAIDGTAEPDATTGSRPAGMDCICRQFEAGQLRHGHMPDMQRQLLAEGRKRLDALVFEAIFRRNLRKVDQLSSSPITISTSWHVGFNSRGHPAYLFRLMTNDRDWNACDEELVKRCEPGFGTHNALIPVRLKLDPGTNKFLASTMHSEGWMAWTDASIAIRSLPGVGKPRAVRNMDNLSMDDRPPALRWLVSGVFADQLEVTSVQRRMMNCLLGCELGRDASDLDALILTETGHLRYVEFKRKYPAKNGDFGLDLRPHVAVRNALAAFNVSMLIVLLVPPHWVDKGSPVNWMHLGSRWTWLGMSADGDGVIEKKMTTRGAKSGQRSGTRTQFTLNWNHICCLADHLKLDESDVATLHRFLADGGLPDKRVTVQWLRSRRATPVQS